MAAAVSVERTEQPLALHHLAHPAQARRGPLLIHQEQRVDRAGGVIHRRHQVVLAVSVRQPGMRRGILVQQHPHHRSPRPLLAMRRAAARRRHQPGPMQLQLGHRVAQPVVVPLAQLVMEMLHREATVEIAIQPQHPLDLRHSRAPQRRPKPTVRQPRQPLFPVAVTPAAECPLTDPKQVRRLNLAQLRPLRPANNILKTHPTNPLVNTRPIHRRPPSRRTSGPDTSRATNTGQTMS
jgi:hypothetical protein